MSAIVSGSAVWPKGVDFYKDKKPIGSGASAVVYLAECKETPVAVKVVNVAANQSFLECCMREVDIWQQLENENIVKYYTSFVSKSEYWIVSEYMDCGSVGDVMLYSSPGGLSDHIIGAIMKPVVGGLAYLHSKDIVHRDIKANNILINTLGEVKVTDFGISNFLTVHGKYSGRAWSFAGTPHWLAPEIVEAEDKGYKCSADIWSLGITAIELAEGRPPLHQLAPIKVLLFLTENEAPELSRDVKHQKAFRHFVKVCLTKNPEKRPTAESLLSHKFVDSAKGGNYLQLHLLNGLKGLVERHNEHLKKLKREIKKVLNP